MCKTRLFGFFVLLLITASALIVSRQTMAESPPTDPTIQLRAFTFDPLAAEPDLPVALQRSTDRETGEGMLLIQFNGPVKQSWKDAVEAAGATLYGYVPDYAFIARMDAAATAEVQKMPFVRWTGVYHPAYALSPDLISVQAQSDVAAPTGLVIQTLPDADSHRAGMAWPHERYSQSQRRPDQIRFDQWGRQHESWPVW